MGLGYTHSNLSRQPAVTLILIMRSKLNQWMSIWWSVQKERFHLPVSLLLRGHEILITHNITEIVWENSSPNHPETNCLMMMFHANENLSCLLLNTNKVNGQHYLAFKKKWPKRHYTGENYFFSKLWKIIVLHICVTNSRN